MFAHRNLRKDLAALVLAALVVFLAVALGSYDPADPLPALTPPLSVAWQADPLVWPPNEHVHNLCGRWGALAADGLFRAVGLGAWYIVAGLGALSVALLRGWSIDTPIFRGIGCAASLAGFTALVAMLLPTWSPGPVIGPGGYVGAMGKALLSTHFATIGSLILAGSFLVGGLLLATDYLIVHFASFGLRLVVASLLGMRVALPLRKGYRSRGSISIPDDDDGEVRIRTRGKRTDIDHVPTSPVEDDAEEAEGEEDEEEPILIPVKKSASAAKEADDDPIAAEPVPPTRTDGAENPLRVRSVADRKREAQQREQELVRKALEQGAIAGGAEDYKLPEIDLLLPADDVNYDAQTLEVRRKAKILEKTFADFGFQVKVVEIETGPVIAQYEVELEAGLRLSKITGLADDLAIALRVPSVRIVAPIPGKNTVGIEVPNEERQVVRLREVIEEAGPKTKKMRIPLFLGKDVSGNALVADLSTLPHLLIAGRTGTGKSVCLNAIISSILMTRRPDEVRLLLIDPKMVELSGYSRLPHLMHPVVTDMRKAEAILAWAVEKMEERYALLARAGVRHISAYNQLGEEELMDRLQPENDEERASIPLNLPFIVIVADEMADLMMQCGKEVEQHIIRLAQKSRAVGIHLILATQKPTVDVITGLIKSNLPARIAFQVASRTDSRVVLDEMGADKLLGNGDMLFLWPGTSTLLRGQGTYLSDEEINQIVACVSTGEQNFVHELVNLKVTDKGEEGQPTQLRKRDEMYEQAVDVVVREGRGSVSLLQRTLGIGYGRAARLIDFMAEDGIVGQYAGSQAREVTITLEQWEQMQAGNAASTAAAPATTVAPPAKRPALIAVNEPVEDDEEDEVDDGDEEGDDDYEVESA
jgi:S-DNA-T family DNA segregation ATPase FtsK/SpoIIIE